MLTPTYKYLLSFKYWILTGFTIRLLKWKHLYISIYMIVLIYWYVWTCILLTIFFVCRLISYYWLILLFILLLITTRMFILTTVITRIKSLCILLFVITRPFIFFCDLIHITYQVKYLFTIILLLDMTIFTYFPLSTSAYVQLLSLIDFVSTFTITATFFLFSICYLLQFVVISFYTFCLFVLYIILWFVVLFTYTFFTQFHTTVFAHI